jgi:hypothetical protein
MARASTPTLLSLDRFARILGINPVHFNGGAGDPVWPRIGQCDETWVQHPWQTMRTISREELAQEIRSSEDTIARYLGWDVAPTWRYAESHRWPASNWRTDNYQHYDARGNQPSVYLNRGKVIAGGRRAVSVIDAGAAVVYSDDDGDGYDETATITVATTLTDPAEIKVYFSNAMDPAGRSWEIRPARRKTISGGNCIIEFDAWLLIDPALWEAFPVQAEKDDIDVYVAGNYVSTVDVYREYNDISQISSELRWRSSCLLCNGSGCAACDPLLQTGCMAVIDPERGIVNPKPATYTDGAWVAATSWSSSTRPETIRFWYYAGDISQDFEEGMNEANRRIAEPLSDYWAQAIAWLTAARLTRQVCSCSNVVEMVNMMQTDLLLNKRETGARFIPGASDIHVNPFGFRYGEVLAWRRVNEAMTWKAGIT